jgi:hypothetical protein
MLNVSMDGGSTWAEYAPALMDFDRYPATLLRFVDSGPIKHQRPAGVGHESACLEKDPHVHNLRAR